MLTALGKYRLKNGTDLEVYCLEPPEDSIFCTMLKELYMNKTDSSRRSIFSSLDGRYAGSSCDRYFFAAAGESIAGALWYGFSRGSDKTANFGHVYTRPDFRGMGIAGILLDHFKADISASGVSAAFCTCSREWIAQMYRNIGFVPVEPGSAPGQLMLPAASPYPNFRDFAADYYSQPESCTVVSGGMEHRHAIDCTGYFSGAFRRRKFLSAQTTANFRQGVFNLEDYGADLLVWQDKRGNPYGWAFTGCLCDGLYCFDFSCHRMIGDEIREHLIRDSLARLSTGHTLTAALASDELSNIKILESCGFIRCGKLQGIVLMSRERT